MASSLTSAEHRGLRELYASARHLAAHWSALGPRLGPPARAALDDGVRVAGDLLDALADETAPHGVHGFPAAQGLGGQIAGLRNSAADLLLERNQALRLAVLDVQHLTTLLPYLRELAKARGDLALARFHGGWARRLAPVERSVRALAIAAGEDPARAILPADRGPAGRAGHALANTFGTVGEAIDASPVGRAARRGARAARRR